MTTLTDARFEALRNQGYTGSMSDMLLQWLQAKIVSATAPQSTVPDAWDTLLTERVGPGARNDRWFTLLGNLGYTGSLNDRELAFWQAGGILP